MIQATVAEGEKTPPGRDTRAADLSMTARDCWEVVDPVARIVLGRDRQHGAYGAVSRGDA